MPPKPEYLRSDRLPIHWLGEDGDTCLITVQGQLLVWKQLNPHPHTPECKTRGQVRTFSKASRLRLLKLFATIDWTRAEPALFITLTYPDDVRITTNKELNVHRYVFIRYIEKLLGKDISVIWRIEWQDRQTGKYVGELYPHFHLMVFNVKYIHHATVNKLWRKTIGYKEYTRTETKGMKCPAQAGFYVAKYVGKETDCSLVNAAYLNTVPPGRQWGLLRPQLLPRCKEQSIRVEASHMQGIREMCEIAYPAIKGYDGSFTLLGKCTIAVAKEIFGELA